MLLFGVKPVPLIVTDVPIGPDDGESELMKTGTRTGAGVGAGAMTFMFPPLAS